MKSKKPKKKKLHLLVHVCTVATYICGVCGREFEDRSKSIDDMSDGWDALAPLSCPHCDEELDVEEAE